MTGPTFYVDEVSRLPQLGMKPDLVLWRARTDHHPCIGLASGDPETAIGILERRCGLSPARIVFSSSVFHDATKFARDTERRVAVYHGFGNGGQASIV